jgi:D-apionolactonase
MVSAKPKSAIKLFGTEAPDGKGRELRAGPLTAILDNGALRYIKLNDVEVLRAIAFLVRDENWGTCTPEIRNQKVRQTPKGFSVSYHARCGEAGRALNYDAEISASANGKLSFTATAKPESDFLTNRTGFIVLHPLKGVAGFSVEIEHVDGKRVKSKFPAIIDPVQPFMNVRSLSHKVIPGVIATCRMEGDAFETEDHRNWTDASFKTYVRPLELPWPYILPKDKAFTQSVTLTLSGKLPKTKTGGAAKPVAISLGRGAGRLPDIAIAVSAAEARHALSQAALLKQMMPSQLLCEIDGRGSDLGKLAETYRKLGEATGAGVTLEIILPGQANPTSELKPIAKAVEDSGLRPDAVVISPAVDLKAILPGSAGGNAPPLHAIYSATRAAFPRVKLGGGMFSFFTELNRKRPPAELLDFVTHTTCPIVHAADDISVMETLEALPYVAQSMRAIIGKNKAYHIGPSTIPARLNPYGASTASNPRNARVCLSDNDPRHRGLYGAAWTLGYVAALAYNGVQQVSAGAVTGPTGIIYHRLKHPQPYFDSLDGTAVYPLYHVLASLAQARGSRLTAVKSSGDGIAALAYGSGKGRTLWLANVTSEARKVKVTGFHGAARLQLLDHATFEKATTDPSFFAKRGKALKKVSNLELAPYSVARLTADA